MFGNNKKKKVKFTGVTEDGRKITGEIDAESDAIQETPAPTPAPRHSGCDETVMRKAESELDVFGGC